MVVMDISHSVSHGNLFFPRSGFPLNLTFGQKKCRFQMCMYYICQCKRPDYHISDFVDFFDFDLDVDVIFSAAALAAGLLEESVFVSCKWFETTEGRFFFLLGAVDDPISQLSNTWWPCGATGSLGNPRSFILGESLSL